MRASLRRPALLVFALLLAGALAAAARQAPRPATNDFLLRVPPSRIGELAQSNGLQVIRAVVTSPTPWAATSTWCGRRRACPPNR